MIELRLGICPTLPFKDAGGWKIQITTYPDHIIISHKKKQSSTTTKPEDQFEFEWHLKMSFVKDLTSMNDPVLTISDLKFGSSTLQTKKDDLNKMFNDYFENVQ